MQSQAQPVRRAPSGLSSNGSTGHASEPVRELVPLDAGLTHRATLARVAGRVRRRRREEVRARTAPLPAPSSALCLIPESADATALRFAGWGGHVKRAVDVLGALLGLVLSAPILAVLAVCIRAESPGPVFFSQARVGRGGRPFRCYKLRTMRRDAESLLQADPVLRAAHEANSFKLPCDADARVTTVGRALRLSSLDELPQLWNVLRGDMSLVGPRPVVVRELSHYTAAERAVLLAVRPGLTGAWAVAGRSRIGYPRRAAIELSYVRDWSLRRDAGILLRTVGAVLGQRGVS